MRMVGRNEGFHQLIQNHFKSRERYLSREEEYRLIQQAKKELRKLRGRTLVWRRDGSGWKILSPAFDTLLCAHYRMILKCAQQFVHLGFDLPDLFQEGVFGLRRAVQKFKVSRKTRLMTYGMRWVDSKIRRYAIEFDDTIRFPNHVAQDVFALHRAAQKLRAKEGREPTEGDLMNTPRFANSTESRKQAVLSSYHMKIFSTETPLPGDGENVRVWGDLCESDPEENPLALVLQEEKRRILMAALHSLAPAEEAVIKYRLAGFTLKEIGVYLARRGLTHCTTKKLTSERARQIEADALRKINRFIEESGIRE